MPGILLDLFILFVAAKVAGMVAERLKQPPVIGELLVGILIGPYALGLVGVPEASLVDRLRDPADAHAALELLYELIAELGVIILLFFVGLETRLGAMLRVGGRAAAVAVLGVVVPFLLGFGYFTLRGEPQIEAIFVGTALVATSVGLTARVLGDLGQLATREARIILGAAVIDDVLGLLVLGIVSALGQNGSVSWGTIGLLALEAAVFTGLIAWGGTHAVRRYHVHLDRLPLRHAPFVVAIGFCLGFAALAGYIGLAAIVGAFLAGVAFAEIGEQYELERQTLPVYELLVPLFFVITGTHVDWRPFVDPAMLGVGLLITALAIVGKLVGCGLGAWGLGRRSAVIVGVGMVPRGEVGLIVASVGRSLDVIPEDLFALVVIMSVLTTVVVPPVLTLLYRGTRRAAPVRAAPDYAVADMRLPDL